MAQKTGTSNPGRTRTNLQVLIASTISCTVTMTVVNPLEVAKLKVQYSPLLCPQYPHPSYNQLKNCECTQFKLKDAFKGLSVSLFHGLISNTLYMQFYEYQRQILIKSLPSSLATIGSAMSSRLLVTTIMIPIEAFRVRFTNSVQKKGIPSKNGLQATLIRDLTYSCLYWLTIEQVRNFLMGSEYRQEKKHASTLYANVVPAMVGGSLISFLTTPLDTLKTRLQSGVEMKGSTFSQLRQIYHKEGHLGLFAGVQQRVLRNTISSVIYLSLFENVIEKLQVGGEGEATTY